jgi:hypothetical protein
VKTAKPRLVALSAGMLGLFASACGCAHENSATTTTPNADALRGDRRVAELLVGCLQSEFYDRDLSDPVPLLLEKLERARPDPLKRAKEELGLLGTKVFPALANAFHSDYSDPMRSAFLENVIDALAFNATDESHELLLEALQHPQESARSKALDGLQRHPHAQDFDLLVERLSIESREMRRQSVAVLYACDHARAEDFFLDALARGEERDLWLAAAPELSSCRVEAVARCAALFPSLGENLAPYVAAGAARHGEASALAFLRAEVRTNDVQRRLTAVNALQRAGMVDELGAILLDEALPEIRAIAVSAIGAAEPTEQRRDWLRAVLSDPSEVVQGAALTALCAQNDPEGLARALAQLDGHPGLLQAALLALRAPIRADLALAQNAYERLLQRHALEEHRPLSQRAATFKAFGQMPLRAAAELLHGLGVAAGDELIESLRAHDWLMIQASNTDLAGRGYLVEALRQERDPLRRIDLIDAIGSSRDDLARTSLLALVEQEAQSPLERLFAANALIRVGPSWEVAPRLKRVAFAMSSPAESEARTALQCLLWYWY